MLRQIADALKRRLDPTTRLMVEVGYLNESLERTQTGVHQLLNFVETHFNGDFVKFLQEIRKKDEEEAKNSE